MPLSEKTEANRNTKTKTAYHPICPARRKNSPSFYAYSNITGYWLYSSIYEPASKRALQLLIAPVKLGLLFNVRRSLRVCQKEKGVLQWNKMFNGLLSWKEEPKNYGVDVSLCCGWGGFNKNETRKGSFSN
ncbi:hypothetical protein CEXT_385881 [Caerostris extrusa]|uniref:Uncharacterized protein n=1 Tax=Caerostris extrusa TaxID=172846 RepID=A0AAV4TU63_CAEEX|nr:hypothetical protein CEXT_385881 [Caerostris extrusa]